MESNCFIDNTFLQHAPVLVYGNQYSATNNYVESSQNDLSCVFMALFNSQDDRADELPTCEMSDAVTCAFSQAPTVAPTQGPDTPAPSQAPKEQVKITETPVMSPTIAPVAASSAGRRTATIVALSFVGFCLSVLTL